MDREPNFQPMNEEPWPRDGLLEPALMSSKSKETMAASAWSGLSCRAPEEEKANMFLPP